MSVYFAPLSVHNTIDRLVDNYVDPIVKNAVERRSRSDRNSGFMGSLGNRVEEFAATKVISAAVKYNFRTKIFNALTVTAGAALTISAANFIFSALSPASVILTIAIIYARVVMKENIAKTHTGSPNIAQYDARPLTGLRDFFLMEMRLV